ncbi:glycosyltransferase family 2 protein [Pedobacter sp. SL55]|uniref:glycosyltransferase family 2 protein n=1 Tax=Pedobacter sp. SL55 TaxID=2995161 RepID=UPI00227124C7|nr:glycosyltransferase family A protein [Pedobacter sp. SL55]WAC39058.1 glycosyltransferase family A protein [Pedobacter sp. SL55]
MLLSVIIPTCNRNDLLKKCLDALHPSIQNFAIDNYEIIVSDDSKENIAKELVETDYNWVKWISGPKKGPAANRNNGARYANGDWLVFLDDDVLPSTDFLANYHKGINSNHNVKAFEGAIIPDDWDLLKKDLAECPINTNGNCFWTANVAINKELFFLIEGFDDSFHIAAQEDQDIFLRLKEHTKIVFLNYAIVVHPVRTVSFFKSITSIYKKSRNYIKFTKKHIKKGRGNLLNFSISQWEFHTIHMLKNIRSFKIKSAIVNICWIFFGVPLNIYLLAKNEI